MVRYLVLVLFLMIILSACDQETLDPLELEPSEAYDKAEALKRGDLVSTARGEGYKNKESFIEFFNNVQNGKEDRVRRTHYSEGIPLFTDLIYKGGKIHVLIDTTHATQSSEDYTKKTHDICSELEKKEEKNKIIYTLNDCTSSSRQVEKIFSVIFER
ncbi:DUF4362 domain-containing protein [Aquibacillus koreensis]|uniref:DUF4362 domain-containing protein n=1 Tax=Aquibacillus koreensis TaxID=279446 RepID=A0A9X3WGV3_9BACI|nr:DUF4362 domain-containing protein [Aquibacillus koreensis]MCT2534867.1 DUF4362 domain-containing protein [Aquibacillus koreensis]MDC3419522.1 DUF4362 domain-containing protein [Aquibacillus koreensis]